MSSTVEIYLADPGDLVSVARRVAVALEAPGYYGSGDACVLGPDAHRWIGAEGFGSLTVARTEFEPEDAEESAFALYDYELSLEYKSGPALARDELRERFARAIFDRLMALGRPLALGDSRAVFADYLPGRGVRDFGSGVDFGESGRDRWYEPRLRDKPAAPAPTAGPAQPSGVRTGRATVFETDGLVHVVPRSPGTGRLTTPVASVRSSAGARLLGRVLAESLSAAGEAGEAGGSGGDPFPRVHGMAGLSAAEYPHAAVSIDITADGEAVAILPHEGYAGSPAEGLVQGPPVERLAAREIGAWNDKAMGDRVLRLIAALREHAYA